MLLNERDVRMAEQHRHNLRREANQERLARASRLRRSDLKSKRQRTLWERLWLLF